MNINTNTINTWPINERPREKLLARGADSLSDSELLAIFIRTGIKGKTAVDLARELLQQHGDLRTLLVSSPDTIGKLAGFGKAKYAELQAALELARRHLKATLNDKDIINNADLAYLYLTAKLRDCKNEIFACLFLNNQNQVISYNELFQGSINNATIYPREIVTKALEYNASNVILAHNHTSGPPTPSLTDKRLTQEMQRILAIIEVKVVDHIIISENTFFSFAKENLLKTSANET
jgi:DNA repair protein RadC